MPRLFLRSLPVSLALALASGAAPSADPAAAPLHPDLEARLTPEARALIPDEPRPPAREGVLGAAALSGRRWSGNPRALVLLVDFEDRPADLPDHDVAHFEELLFGEDDGSGFPSLRQYFVEATGGAIAVEGEVHGWFRMPLSSLDYASGESGFCACYPNNARGLATHALEAALAAGVDVRDFDNDGPDGLPDSGDDDGILDALVVVHAGTGAERSGSLDDIRSHTWTFANPPEIAGIRIPDYAMIPELENVGVAVHEFGHLLGGEDLYDLSGRGAGLGWYSVMAHAFWYNNGRQPGGPDPFTRMAWGVLDPIRARLDEPDMELPAVPDAPAALRLWTEGREEREFFLVEYRRPRGIDRYLPGEGLLVYHVDTSMPFQNDPRRYRVRLVAADGLESMQGVPPVNRGEPGDFFPGTLGVRAWDDDTVPSARNRLGEATGVALRGIGDAGGETLRFGFEVGRSLGLDGPDPVLRVEPEAGLLEPIPGPGESLRLALVVENRGSRLRGGTLRLLARDPAVEGVPGASIAVPPIPALGTYRIPGTVQVRVDPDAGTVPLALEAEWITDAAVHSLAGAVPDERAVLRRFDFEAESSEIRAFTLRPAREESYWVRQGDYVHRGERAWGVGGRGGFPAALDEVLELGPFPMPGPGEFRFRHRMFTIAGDGKAFDGGFVEIARGAGPWEPLVPPGGYPAAFVLTQQNPYAGWRTWAGDLPWSEVRIPLEGGAPLRLRFHFVSDFSGTAIAGAGWFVDDAVLLSWPAAHRAVIEEPEPAGDALRVRTFSIPLFPSGEPSPARLVRESPGERLLLGTVDLQGGFSRTVLVPGRTPGQSYRFLLEPVGGNGVLAERRVTIPLEEGSLLEGTPSVLARRRGGWITLRVPGEAAADVRLDLFDVRGRRMGGTAPRDLGPGLHRVAWSDLDLGGRNPGAGVYFLRLRVGDRSETRRITVL